MGLRIGFASLMVLGQGMIPPVAEKVRFFYLKLFLCHHICCSKSTVRTNIDFVCFYDLGLNDWRHIICVPSVILPVHLFTNFNLAISTLSVQDTVYISENAYSWVQPVSDDVIVDCLVIMTLTWPQMTLQGTWLSQACFVVAVAIGYIAIKTVFQSGSPSPCVS